MRHSARRIRHCTSPNPSTGGRSQGVFLRGRTVWYRYSYQGRQYRVSLDTQDEGEALTRALRIRNNPVLMDANPLQDEIEDCLREKLEDQTYTRNSADTRHAVLNAWANQRGLKEVRQITRDEIDLWQRSLRKGKHRLKELTIETYGMILRGFCTWLVKKKKLRESPAAHLKSRVSSSGKKRLFCKRDQVDALINQCPDVELKFIFLAGFHAGLRKDEIIQARPSWFDLELRILHITESDEWKPKDKDKRTIPLSERFCRFLTDEMSVKGKLPGPFLIRPNKQQGKARYRYDFRKPFAEYVKKKGPAWLTPHIMRHTFASLLAIAGVSIFKIAQWLGDDVLIVGRHYAHLMPQDSDIERAFGEGKPQATKQSGINDAL